MPSYNKVILIGNLTRDPENKAFANGNSVTEFSLAVNRKYQTQDGDKKEEVTFVGVKAFNKPGEVIAKYVRKGDPFMVEGRLSQDNWEDQNGNKRSKTYVMLEKFEFLKGQSDPSERQESQPEPPKPKPTASQSDMELNDDPLDEDVPF